MSIAALPYSAQYYNSLPSIEYASKDFKPEDVDCLTTSVGEVFIKHKVERFFGIILLHKHFTLNSSEVLINVGPVAVPWRSISIVEQPHSVKGSAWRFTEQGIAPYEFVYDSVPRPDIVSFQPFLSELKAVFDHLGLTEKLGICVFATRDPDAASHVESTHGRTNITLPSGISHQDRPDNMVETIWQFDMSPGQDTQEVTEATSNPVVHKEQEVSCVHGADTEHQTSDQ